MKLFTFETANSTSRIKKLVERSKFSRSNYFIPKGAEHKDKSGFNKKYKENPSFPTVHGTEKQLRSQIKQFWKSIRLGGTGRNKISALEIKLTKEMIEEMVDDMVKMKHEDRRQYVSDYFMNLLHTKRPTRVTGE